MAKRPDPASRRPPHPLTSKPQPALTVKNPRAAGIDVHDGVHWVAVPPDRDPQPVRPFGAFTVDLEAIADWFTQCGVDTVAMESTGVYWIPLYELLERRGFRVYLVDARAVAKVDGRPKTDIHDCQWIQRLHSYGLLEKAFRPQDDIVVLRGFVRQRQVLISHASQHIQHMQKALVLMNLKLTLVVSDIVGKTGMAIIKAILAGERDPVVLSQWRDERCKHTREEIAKALMGNWREEHLLALRQAVELYEFYHRKISECDQAIDAYLSRLPNRAGDRPMEKRPAKCKNKDNEPMFDARKRLYEMLGVDLTAIDGISVGVALTIASELGCDVQRLPQREGVFELAGPGAQPQDHRGKDQEPKDQTGSQPHRDWAADGSGQFAAHADGSRGVRTTDAQPGRFAQSDHSDCAQAGQVGVSDAEVRRGLRAARRRGIRGQISGASARRPAAHGDRSWIPPGASGSPMSRTRRS